MNATIDHTFSIGERQPYNSRENPCKRDCPDRKAGCAKDCSKWAKYAAGRAERYAHNERFYSALEALRTPINRDKRGQF